MRRLLPLLIALLFAAACGDDSGSAPADPTTTSAPPTTSPSTTSAPQTSAPTTTTTTAAPAPTIPVPPASTVEGILALDHPVVIGHAGGDQAWPKSTMFAFREAALAGTHVLEMDVQLTGDGVLVVIHDDTVDRTTGATGRVRDLTYEELQALDHAYWWSTEWSSHDLPEDRYVYRGIRTGDAAPPEGYGPDDFRVETFRAVAEAFPDHVLDVEIKVPDGDDGEDDFELTIDGARVLAEEIESLGRTDSVIVVSFNDEVTAAFREFAPDVATSPGTTSMFSWIVGSADLHPNDRVLQLPPEFDGVDVLGIDGLLPNAAEAGLDIWVWPNSRSQENPEFYADLVALGIDGLLVGHPDLAMDLLRAEGLVS